jgi:serine/threonine protein kinase
MDPVVADRMRDELVGKSVGGWTPEKILGNGKSAVVFRACKGDQIAALKVFDPDLVKRYGEPTQLERINRERLLIGKQHPHLVRIFDGGKCGLTGYLFVAMEFIEALDLEKALPEVPQDRIRPLIAQLASAAKFLEEMNLERFSLW